MRDKKSTKQNGTHWCKWIQSQDIIVAANSALFTFNRKHIIYILSMWLIEEHIVLHQIEKYCAKFRNCIAQPAAQRHICDGIWVSKCVCMWCSTDALATQLSTDCIAGTRQMTSIPIGWNKEKLKESEIEREKEWNLPHHSTRYIHKSVAWVRS